jgi:RNA polymerase sigma-70 factor (ECF subfamily)
MKVNYTSYTDAQLAEGLNLQDVAAFEEVYDRYWNVLFIHACKMTGDQEKAKDLVQDLFTALFAKMGELHFESTISAYLYRSVQNRVISAFNHQKVKHNYAASLQAFYNKGELATENHVREKELKILIEKEIDNLPGKMKSIFEMSRRDNMSHKEIATASGVSEGTVKKQLYYAITRLRSKLSYFLIIFL